jgi:hypothetical protein
MSICIIQFGSVLGAQVSKKLENGKYWKNNK